MTRLMVIIVTLFAFSALAQAAEPSTARLDSLRVIIADGQYDQAATEAEDLVTQWEEQFGTESLEVARALDLQAKALSLAERSAEPGTIEIILRAIDIKTETPGPRPPGNGDLHARVGVPASPAW